MVVVLIVYFFFFFNKPPHPHKTKMENRTIGISATKVACSSKTPTTSTPQAIPKRKTHSPETSDFGLLAFSTSPLLLDERASSSLRPCPRSLLFLSPLRFSCPATARFPSSSSLPFLIFRSSLARLSRSKPSAFLLARFSSFSLTTHGSPSTSFRNAVFSAQAAASSFVVRTMAMRNTIQSRSLSRLRGPVETYISARVTSASFP